MKKPEVEITWHCPLKFSLLVKRLELDAFKVNLGFAV
jgi:hypothetical protein